MTIGQHLKQHIEALRNALMSTSNVEIDLQLGLPGIDDDVIYVRASVVMQPIDYIHIQFSIDNRTPLTHVDPPSLVGEEKACEQMERVLAGDLAWTQLNLLLRATKRSSPGWNTSSATSEPRYNPG